MTFPLPHRPRRQVRVILTSTEFCRSCRCGKPPRWRLRSWAWRRSLLPVPPDPPRRLRRLVRARGSIVGAFVRAIDIESWALLVPGGVVARVDQAFGPRAAKAAAAAGLVERLLLAALACVLVGQYASTVALTAIAGLRLTGYVRPEDFATVVAVLMVALLWLRLESGWI